MTVDGESGSGLDETLLTLDSTPPAAPTPGPSSAARIALAASAVAVLSFTVWGIVSGEPASVDGDVADPVEPEEVDPVVDEAVPTADAATVASTPMLALAGITATAGAAGTELVALDLGGPPPTRLVSGAPTPERVPDDLLGLFIQRSPEPLTMCDSSHGWGTTDAVGAITLTLPRAWFDVADGPLDVAIDGDLAAKIIVCALAGGGPIEITVHGPATLVREQIEVTETPAGLALRLGEGPPFDATSVPAEYAALIEGVEIFGSPDVDAPPDMQTLVDSMLRSTDGDPVTVRIAHVGDEQAVLVWMASGDREPYEDVSLVACIGLIEATTISASCQPPVGALAGTLSITVVLDDQRRSVYLATPDQAMRADALGLPVDRGVVIVERAMSDRPLVVGLDGELAALEADN